MKFKSSSIEHSEKQPPQNLDLAKNRMSAQPSSSLEDKLKLDTHDIYNLSESMEDKQHNDASKSRCMQKTLLIKGQNPLPDMQVLPDVLMMPL